MAFEITRDDIKKSQKTPPGMHLATLTEVEETYFNDKGTEIQKANFDTDSGFSIPYWFNNKMPSAIIAFVEAADKVKLTEDAEIDIKDYVGKKVCLSVSHIKDKNNKIQSQIDDFYSSDKVPF